MVAFSPRSKSHEAESRSQGNNRRHGLNPLTARFLDWLHPQTYVLVTTVHSGGAALQPNPLCRPRLEISEFPSETLPPPPSRAMRVFKLLNGFLTRKRSVRVVELIIAPRVRDTRARGAEYLQIIVYHIPTDTAIFLATELN